MINNPYGYINEEVTLEGKVLKNNRPYSENEFEIELKFESNHAYNDLYFMAKYDKTNELRDGDKVTLTGIISEAEEIGDVDWCSNNYYKATIDVTKLKKND